MKFLYIFLSVIVIIVVVSLFFLPRVPVVDNPVWGVSFAKDYAQYLGLDWRATYQAILDDLQVRHLRLQANWNEIEPQASQFDFTDIDWQIAEASKRGAQVTLVIGRKLPRWPECHEPTWVKDLSPWDQEEQLFKMLRAVVEHYQQNQTVVRWQLENEPLFYFGLCPKPNRHLLLREVALVKSLDSRPILITDSGELSSWWETAGPADVQGSTLYKTTYAPLWGYWHYPLPAWYYRLKAALISPWVDKTIISELQMEPWGPKGLADMTLAETQVSFNQQNFRDNIQFFKKVGFSEAYLWGVEWWYKAKVMGDDSLWREAQNLFKPPS